ncbi:MAG: DUF6144 family protein [Anaerolineae bacterium]|nr:DUF6144 family protein [Anaerolineae bacterium]
MSQMLDFERAWLSKFTDSLDRVAGEKTRQEVMKGSENLSSNSSRDGVIAWSKAAMERLDSLVDQEKRVEIMTSCACRYPVSDLREIRKAYEETRDIGLAHGMLLEKFEVFLRGTLQLEDGLVEEILGRGWGLAGVRQGNRIIATKIPKSGYLVEYMRETDPQRKRQHYCHCPRIRDVLKSSETISPTYCYCGAGFYKGIWEEILQEHVEVELLESVLKGDDVCKVAIHLPADR